MSVRRNTLWNLLGSGAPFIVGAATIPYVVKHAGVEVFGILTLVWALIGYFSLFDFGLGRALTQQIARAIVEKQDESIPVLVKTGLMFTLLTGLAGGILLATLALPLASTWLGVSAELRESVLHSLIIASIGIPLVTVTTGLRGILEAFEDFKTSNMLRLFLGVANFGLPALSVFFFGPSLQWMVLSLITARVVIGWGHWFLVMRRFPTSFWAMRFESKKIRQLWTFGAWMTVSNVVSPLMVTCDRFIISAVLGASVVAFYTVPFEVLVRILVLPAALAAAIFPRISGLLVGEKARARVLYKKSILIVAGGMLAICLPSAIFSEWGLALWLGNEFAEKSWQVASVLAIGLFFNGIAHVPFAAIQASGQARVTAQLHLAELAVYVPVLLVCLHFGGLLGAAVAWALRVFADFILLSFYARKLWSHERVKFGEKSL